ncbi:MAG: sugar phosphate isomerase/epimerase [Verrucomicrobia bacterium]|nr:sugar phosphate isomerase/epimerase [Verrucomicrobiota bacterium]
MRTPALTRRDFVGHTIGVAALAALAQPASLFSAQPDAEAGRPRAIRLGGPAFVKADDPEAFAQAHRKLGYSAAYCPGIAVKDSDRIKALAEACARHDVVIAEVGRWVNLLDADADKRKQNLDTVIDGLALAEAVGARCCVDIAGSFNPKIWYGPHPDNFTPKFFDAVVENARKIIDAVKPKRAKFCYEMMGWALPDSPDSYLKMIRAVDHEAFGVHLDPCNLVNSPERFYRNTDLLNECFDKLGRWIASCHAKDLTWDVEMNVHFREIVAGQGSLDYTTYLKRLAQLPQSPPLMLEHLSKAEEYDAARRHILETGRQAGLSFA